MSTKIETIFMDDEPFISFQLEVTVCVMLMMMSVRRGDESRDKEKHEEVSAGMINCNFSSEHGGKIFIFIARRIKFKDKY